MECLFHEGKNEHTISMVFELIKVFGSIEVVFPLHIGLNFLLSGLLGCNIIAGVLCWQDVTQGSRKLLIYYKTLNVFSHIPLQTTGSDTGRHPCSHPMERASGPLPSLLD